MFTTLLVPDKTDASLQDELRLLKQKAECNKMILNLLKTKEIVFFVDLIRLASIFCLAPLSDVERVNSVKLLGNYFSDTLRFVENITFVSTICGQQRLYSLKTI